MGGDSGSLAKGGGESGRRNVALEKKRGTEQEREDEQPAGSGAVGGEEIDEDNSGEEAGDGAADVFVGSEKGGFERAENPEKENH